MAERQRELGSTLLLGSPDHGERGRVRKVSDVQMEPRLAGTAVGVLKQFHQMPDGFLLKASRPHGKPRRKLPGIALQQIAKSSMTFGSTTKELANCMLKYRYQNVIANRSAWSKCDKDHTPCA